MLLHLAAVSAAMQASAPAAVLASEWPPKVGRLHNRAIIALDVSNPAVSHGFGTVSSEAVDSGSDDSSSVVAADATVSAAVSCDQDCSTFNLQRRLLQTIQGDPPATEPPKPDVPATAGASSGQSYNNPTDFPVPAEYQPVISAVHRIMGRDVIHSRVDVEKAFSQAFKESFEPIGIKVRWLNYTTHAEPKTESKDWYIQDEFRAVDQQVLMYQRPLFAGETSNLTMGSVFNQTAFLQQIVTQQYGQTGVSLIVLSEKALTQNFSSSQIPYGAARTVIELAGPSLLPFTTEKANAMLQAVELSFLSLLTSRVFFANFSSDSIVDDNVAAARPVPGPRNRRMLLQSQQPDKIRAVVWTGLQPLQGSNMADLWNGTFNQANAQQVYIVNSDQSIGVAYTYRNFTSTSVFLSNLPITGRYISSQLYELNDVREGFVLSNMKPGPPQVFGPSEGVVADSPQDALPPLGSPEPGSSPGTVAVSPMRQVPSVPSSRRNLGAGAIAGIAAGGLFLAVLLVIAGLLAWRRSRRNAKSAAAVGLDKPPASPSSSVAGSAASTGVNGVAGSSRQLASLKWQWSDPDSGVMEPVWAPIIVSHGAGPDKIYKPPLHRACELFADDKSPASTAAQVAETRADSLPPLGGRSSHVATSVPLQRRSDDEAAAFVSGRCDSFPCVPTSAPFVAGEIDPTEIEFCLDADGNQVVLGEGAFGRVYKGLRRGVHEVAIKQVGNLSDPQLIRQFRKEIAILGRVSFQPNIVNFYGACLRDPTNIMLIMENMAGGDLRKALSKSENGEFTWYQKGRTLALDIAKGLHFLHSSQVTHRDLKTSNILLSRDGHTAKIGDVGLSRSTLTDFQSSLATVGTFCYAAPELLMGERCCEAIDLFSYGVCLWEVVTGAIPVRGYIRDVGVPSECPSEVRQLISDCMESDPKLRPTAEELVRRMVATPEERPQEAASDVPESAAAAAEGAGT